MYQRILSSHLIIPLTCVWQCNPDIRDPDIRAIFSGPKLEPVLPKQNRHKTAYKRLLLRYRQLSYILFGLVGFMAYQPL